MKQLSLFATVNSFAKKNGKVNMQIKAIKIKAQ